jgi:hypothetical protein
VNMTWNDTNSACAMQIAQWKRIFYAEIEKFRSAISKVDVVRACSHRRRSVMLRL